MGSSVTLSTYGSRWADYAACHKVQTSLTFIGSINYKSWVAQSTYCCWSTVRTLCHKISALITGTVWNVHGIATDACADSHWQLEMAGCITNRTTYHGWTLQTAIQENWTYLTKIGGIDDVSDLAARANRFRSTGSALTHEISTWLTETTGGICGVADYTNTARTWQLVVVGRVTDCAYGDCGAFQTSSEVQRTNFTLWCAINTVA